MTPSQTLRDIFRASRATQREFRAAIGVPTARFCYWLARADDEDHGREYMGAMRYSEPSAADIARAAEVAAKMLDEAVAELAAVRAASQPCTPPG